MLTAYKTIVQLFPTHEEALKHMQICGIADPSRQLTDMIKYPNSNLEECCRRVEFLQSTPEDTRVRIIRVVKFTGPLEECLDFLSCGLSLRFAGRPQTSSILATDNLVERKR